MFIVAPLAGAWIEIIQLKKLGLSKRRRTQAGTLF